MAVFKRNGAWWVGFPTADGRYRREKVGSSYRLAQQVLAKRLTAVAEEQEFPERIAASRPFSLLLDRYWELHGRNLRSRSWKSVLRELRASFGSLKVGQVDAGRVQEFYSAVAARSSWSNANRSLTLLRSVFSRAKVWGLFHGDNPASAIARRPEPPHRLRYLSKDEWERLYAAANPRLKPVLLVAFKTGMRKSELLALDWRDVDLARGLIFVRMSKSGRSREIELPASVREMLVALGPETEGRIFALPEITLRRYFAKAVAAARVPDFTFHGLRHSFASWYAMATGDLASLQRTLGHATIVLTMRYAHLARGHMAASMARFDQAVPFAPEGAALKTTASREANPACYDRMNVAEAACGSGVANFPDEGQQSTIPSLPR